MTRTCIVCGVEFEGKTADYCPPCRKQQGKLWNGMLHARMYLPDTEARPKRNSWKLSRWVQ